MATKHSQPNPVGSRLDPWSQATRPPTEIPTCGLNMYVPFPSIRASRCSAVTSVRDAPADLEQQVLPRGDACSGSTPLSRS